MLIFDTASYAVQARFFRRLAFYVEKQGYRGRLLTDAELGSRRGYNAHDYIGLQPESTLPVGGGEVSLRGAPDVERTFSGAQTVVLCIRERR